MNFSVHFDPETVARLNAAVERVGFTRNRIIVRAVQDWLVRNEALEWPEDLRDHWRNPAPELSAGPAEFEPWRPMATLNSR
ncbi:MAG: CopG family transcriptional regulator [Panacagrimonas sp.]